MAGKIVCKQHLEGKQLQPASERVPDKPLKCLIHHYSGSGSFTEPAGSYSLVPITMRHHRQPYILCFGMQKMTFFGGGGSGGGATCCKRNDDLENPTSPLKGKKKGGRLLLIPNSCRILFHSLGYKCIFKHWSHLLLSCTTKVDLSCHISSYVRSSITSLKHSLEVVLTCIQKSDQPFLK